MTAPSEFDSALREAERGLAAAATAEDVRSTWRKHLGVLGHRALGRLLLGRPAEELAARRAARADGD